MLMNEKVTKMDDRNQNLPEGFTYLSEPSILIVIAYATSDNFMGRPLKGYHKNLCILTHEAAQALLFVQKDLTQQNPNLHLKIFDAYRPDRAVQDIIRWAEDPQDERMKSLYFPNIAKQDLLSEGYLAKKNSMHSSGSTVDLTIVQNSEKGYQEWDMGTHFDFFGEQSHTFYPDLTPKQKQNRLFLKNLMEKRGFVNYEKEWWHYSLKDEPFANIYFDFPVA